MIIAEVNPIAPDFYMVRFSDPSENLENKKFIPVRGTMSEVERIMYFKNKTYIADTLSAFLKQRSHAIPKRYSEIQGKIVELRTQQTAVFRVFCKFVASNITWIKSISPSEKSNFRNHFNTVIEPILSFCETTHQNQENDKTLQRTI